MGNALLGPVLVRLMLYVTLEPAITGPGEPLLVIARSALVLATSNETMSAPVAAVQPGNCSQVVDA